MSECADKQSGNIYLVYWNVCLNMIRMTLYNSVLFIECRTNPFVINSPDTEIWSSGFWLLIFMTKNHIDNFDNF